MDFLDDYDDGRPKLIFQSTSSSSIESPQNSPLLDKPLIFISLTFSLLFLASSLFFFQSQILQSLSLWFFFSLLLGPFAPLSLTAGDVRVGEGKIVEFPLEDDSNEVDELKKKLPSKRNRVKRSDLEGSNANGSFNLGKNGENPRNLVGPQVDSKEKINGFCNSGENISGSVIEEKDWSDGDLGLLRKQVMKHPVGKPRRWEVIAEAFSGRHSVESVIHKAKSLGNEKPTDSESYSKFLKDRKPMGKRLEGGNEELVGKENGGEVISWSSSEDIALLNALKAFPKNVPMRWEKIAASVPGKSKAVCMKRVSELKKEFRSSKGS